ncbi:MAG: hypothetical protein ACTSRW_10830 [Candidatus Helarchaeota archaeon]
MVEIIEVEDLFYGNSQPGIRMRSKQSFYKLAMEKRVPYIFKKGQRLFFNDSNYQYTYRMKPTDYFTPR